MKRTQTSALVFAMTISSLAATTAIAGERRVYPVSIIQTDPSSNIFVSGALVDARASNDRVQHIGCNNTVGYSGFCHARDADGRNVACHTNDHDLVDVIRSITPESFITFIARNDGTCAYVFVSTSSSYKPFANSGY